MPEKIERPAEQEVNNPFCNKYILLICYRDGGTDAACFTALHGSNVSETNEFCHFCSLKSETLPIQLQLGDRGICGCAVNPYPQQPPYK